MINNVLKYEIVMDLCKDYTDIIRSRLADRRIFSSKNGRELWYEFFNLQKKSIEQRKRAVKIAKEFSCPKNVKKGLSKLIEQIESGRDLNVYLSKDAGSSSKFDSLLYDWGIYHFHLGEKINHATGLIDRTGLILFARIDEDNIYFINVYRHGQGVDSRWAKQEMINILHKNWPEKIKLNKMEGCLTVGNGKKIRLNTQMEYGEYLN